MFDCEIWIWTTRRQMFLEVEIIIPWDFNSFSHSCNLNVIEGEGVSQTIFVSVGKTRLNPKEVYLSLILIKYQLKSYYFSNEKKNK